MRTELVSAYTTPMAPAVDVGTDWPIIENSNAKYEQALTVVRDDMKFSTPDDKSGY